MTFKLSLTTFLAVLVTVNVTSVQSFANFGARPRTIKLCNETNKFPPLPMGQALTHKELPKGTFVARKANYYAETTLGTQDAMKAVKEKIKIHGFQQFVSTDVKSDVKCATTVKNESRSFQITAPTLIDTTEEQKLGNSIWQFQMSATEQEVAVWNTRSQLLFVSKDATEKMKFYHTAHNEYVLVIDETAPNARESILVVYDFLPN